MHDFCSIIIIINKYTYLNKNFLNNIFYRDISLNRTIILSIENLMGISENTTLKKKFDPSLNNILRWNE